MFTLEKIKNILNNDSPEQTEQLAQEAAQLTRQYFGRAIALYAPLYISNYCSSHCTYCGFNNHHKIKRIKLSPEQIDQEAHQIADMGIEDLLILTGESYQMTPLSYLKESVEICKKYFPSISMEIHPLEENDYHELFCAGVDGVTVYQETYDRARYKEVHLAGKKSDYDFRYHTPERIARAGIRRISLGILLGLGSLSEDLFALFQHLRFMEQHFPGVEYSISFPRLRKIKGRAFAICNITDIDFIKAICMTRILFPRVGINLSTRESESLRNNALGIGVTRISAGSNTAVGGYSLEAPSEQDPQFDIADERSVKDVIAFLKSRSFDPVLTDWRRIENA
jgi:2-iminoacetate synthase